MVDRTTVEEWVRRWLRSDSVADRLDPAAPPAHWDPSPAAEDVRPTRPRGLRIAATTPRSLRVGALREPAGRVRALHTFCHHEVQAAELFGWALLRFADAEADFRAGLLALLGDELRHARLYAERLAANDARYGDLPVRDWFWERGVCCTTPLAFVAFVGMGLEGGNLEHARRFADGFRAAGDVESARVQDRIAAEEVAHVRFAAQWFARWTGGLDFETWRAQLPEPVSPTLLRGAPLARDARRRAGQPDAFLDALEAWPCRPSGC